MRADADAGARLIEISRVGMAGKNHGASAVSDAIVQLCGNIVKELVHGVGGGIGGRGFLGTNDTEGDEYFFVNRTALLQEVVNNALDALDVHIVDRRAEIGLRKVLSLGAI